MRPPAERLPASRLPASRVPVEQLPAKRWSVKRLSAKLPWRSSTPEPQTRSPAARAALRAATLLRGGVPASQVWRRLAQEVDAPTELLDISQRIADGWSSAAALAACQGQEWRVLAVAWHLAEQSGAPISAVLERIAAALASLERLGQRRSVLLAGPRATIRLVAALPAVALFFGAILGFDPIPVLLSPAGAVLAVFGAVLLFAGVRWANRLTDQLAEAEWVSGLECELCWIGLSGGAAPVEALRRVVDGVDRARARWVRLSAMTRDGVVHTVLDAAAALGTPAGPMLLAEAESVRTRAFAELEREAERLGVRVLLPLGVCVLPSFIVLGVLPVLLAVMGSLGPLA